MIPFQLNRYMKELHKIDGKSFLTYNLFSQESERNKKNSSMLVEPLKTSLDKSNFVEISINISIHGLAYITFSSGSAPYRSGVLLDLERAGNYEEYFIFQISHEFLEFPFKSSCSDYFDIKTPFNSFSYKHCIRQCYRYYCESVLGCSCTLVNGSISQIDNGFSNLDICWMGQRHWRLFNKKYLSKCYQLCPIDCVSTEYIVRSRDSEEKKITTRNIQIHSFSWDNSKPFMTYREVPIMSFTDYFNFIGGLFGMWFGFSANRSFEYLTGLKESRIFKILISISLDTLIKINQLIGVKLSTFIK